jgi:soluble lytic murein transglycosylase
MLLDLGFTQEAAAELVHMSGKNGDPQTLKALSVSLNRLGDFRTSVTLAAKIPYSDDLHEILYPLAYWQEVDAAARQTGVDPLLILAVMREESRFAADARSIAGALGLMQLMPATAQRMSAPAQVKVKGSEDILNQRTNILLGSSYLKSLMSTFNSLPLSLAAYNAGEHNVSEWVQQGRYRSAAEFIEDIPFSETRTYVKKVMTTYFEYLRAAGDHDLDRIRKQMGSI